MKRYSKISLNRRLALVLLAFASFYSSATLAQEESLGMSEIELPRSSRFESAVEINLGPAARHRGRVDPECLAVTPDGIVRYCLEVISTAGARNVTFEGMRCATRETIVYAVGRADGTWVRTHDPRWTSVVGRGRQTPAAILMRDYFCSGGAAVRNRAEGVRALRQGVRAGAH